MNVPFKCIRERLGLSQAQLAAALGMTQGNVSFYELGKQAVKPDIAGKLIEFSKSKGLDISYDHVYGAAELPPADEREGRPEHAKAA